MTLEFDLFWSFRSPYSYLATPRIVALSRRYDVTVNVRPVYPIAVRIPGFFKTVNPLWPPYVFKDTTRIAEMEGIPYGWPRPDPVVMDLTTGDVPAAQPYIHRLTRLGVLAQESGLGLSFIHEVSRIIWSGEIDGWNEGNHLKEAAARAGLNLPEMDAVIAERPDRYERLIAENETAQKDAGHWGVPLMAFRGEPFFGQDRIGHLVWRMKQHGLRERT